MEALANRAAAGFQKLGVGPGVHVGLYLLNTRIRSSLFPRAEARRNRRNYSPLAALQTLEIKIEDSETDILVTLDLAALYPQAEKLAASTRLKTLVVGELAEMSPAPGPVKAQMGAAGMLAEVKHDDRHLAFRDLIDNDGSYRAHPLGDLSDALAVIQYTGGTTGTPKGARPTHANLTAACSLYMEVMSRSGPRVAEGWPGALSLHPAAVPYLFVVRRHAARIPAGGGARAPFPVRSRCRRQGHRRQTSPS